MNAQPDPPQHAQPHKSALKAPVHFKASRGSRHKKTIQIIYAYLPPVSVLVREQHLRTQTYLEQRAQQLCFDRNGLKEGLEEWLKNERSVVQNLSRALLRGNTREMASNFNPY